MSFNTKITMTETPNPTTQKPVLTRSPMGRNEKILMAALLFVASIALFIRFVPVSFLGIDVVALSPGSAPTTIEKIDIEGTETYIPEGAIKFTTVTI